MKCECLKWSFIGFSRSQYFHFVISLIPGLPTIKSAEGEFDVILCGASGINLLANSELALTL
jgi:hypothetical protein